MIIDDLDYGRYAALLIDVGVNLKDGQNLLIRSHPGGLLLARACAAEAYRRGARLVEIQLRDSHLTKARAAAQAGNDEALAAHAGWTDAWQNTLVDEGWAYLALESFEDVGLLADADQDAVRLLEKYGVESRRRFRDAVISHAIPWCVAAVPGPKWAALVLGDEARTEDLWAVMQSILMLDRDDPAAAWRDKSRILTERSAYLNGLDLDALRFEDEGTDLTVGLLPNARWIGGPKHIDGRPNMANIPTEEVFTTPDRRRCDGHVRVTRPVEVRGTVVRGADLRFEDGQLADYRIEDGIEAFRGFLGTDAGAVRLGEVALVGEDSPIAASGLNFGSILYDENASCHIALGSGYASCLENADELTDDAAKEAAGCNASLVHRDFMIGSPTMNVTGRLRDGSSVPLLRDGRVVF